MTKNTNQVQKFMACQPKECKQASDLEQGHIYARSCYKIESLQQKKEK